MQHACDIAHKDLKMNAMNMKESYDAKTSLNQYS